jgi:hypothetical protein
MVNDGSADGDTRLVKCVALPIQREVISLHCHLQVTNVQYPCPRFVIARVTGNGFCIVVAGAHTTWCERRGYSDGVFVEVVFWQWKKTNAKVNGCWACS